MINNRPWAIEAVCAAEAAYLTNTHSAFESEGLLLKTAETPIFAVRGTTFDGFRILSGDALLDGLAVPWRCNGFEELGWCHKGFLRGKWWGEPRGALGLWRAAKNDLLNEPLLMLTGHSKGAAEATIIAALLCLAGRPPQALITFGAPMAASSEPLLHLLRAIPHQRHYIHGDDIVPKLPAAPWWQDWEHKVWVTGGNGLAGGGALLDHKIAAYRRAIFKQYS